MSSSQDMNTADSPSSGLPQSEAVRQPSPEPDPENELINQMRVENQRNQLIILRLGSENERKDHLILQQAEEIRFMTQENRDKDRTIQQQGDALDRITRERDRAILESGLIAIEKNEIIIEKNQAILAKIEAVLERNQLADRLRRSVALPLRKENMQDNTTQGTHTDERRFSMEDDPVSRLGWQLLQPPSRTGASIPCTFVGYYPVIQFHVPETSETSEDQRPP
ncbi:hypothetical protein LEL_05335 [Akanthomyces lecanii RCEF 1005]|uniref:Uncharacterized protein n=1 Tax=Akanthomyces lecanii RCEF 1005 TaxID=1081108 RepID=A0A162K6C5_CORDF|nr:hypothetical protein LEL_05335 [Akanthomyces lecanii RCEF 1005]